MLSASELRAGYGPIEALHGVSIQVEPGEIVTVIGANGAGKSTLMKTLAGLLPARTGRITFAGRDITRLPPHQRAASGLVLVPEGRGILGSLTVRDNLLLGAGDRADPAAVQADMSRLLDRFPVLRQRLDQLAGLLSGGEQQMLALARALVSRPRCLLLDEPSLGLAPRIVAEVFALIDSLRSEGLTILLVEQNARQALAIADRAYVLETGRVQNTGPARELAGSEAVRAAYLGKAAKSGGIAE